jgi:hypothetical protein
MFCALPRNLSTISRIDSDHSPALNVRSDPLIRFSR